MTDHEVFGTDEQRALLRRGRAMAELVAGDPRYSYYGRTVGLMTPEDGDLDRLSALIRVQGNASYAAVPTDDAAAIAGDLTARGFVPVRYDTWEGGADALEAARDVVARHELPDDLTLVTLDAATAPGTVASFAAMALGCGVLPLSGDVMRGAAGPAICVAAVDGAGAVMSCAASAAYAHPDHPTCGGQAWWGMLATDPARRGERLALILGAHAMLEMARRFELSRFMTGVARGNAPSEAVCRRMGLAVAGHEVVGAADPGALAGGRMTK
ncbi:N-acetyltransferase [uncultured Jannaschia sp.]|uniref:N-acetyltransferase n=1 Tax=uncultured Jannaschia sp. TaxID=293347 RepID=UPI0026177BE4|nr:N-acetyltransferase [uncultured Jannaschia sp.]